MGGVGPNVPHLLAENRAGTEPAARKNAGTFPKFGAPVRSFFQMADGLRVCSEYGVQWHYKVTAEARPQDKMIEGALERKHAAFFSREVRIEHGRASGRVTNQYGSSPSWPMFYDTAFAAMSPKERCIYEIIVGRCLPYLDVEWLVAEMPAATIDLLLALVDDFAGFAEERVPGLEARGTHRVSSACNAAKHSYHVVFRTRLGGRLAAYDDNKYAFYGLIAEYRKALFARAKGGEALARSFFRQFSPDEPPEKSMAIFDMKVYTKNRIFRTVGSCKLKDPSRVFVKRGDHDWVEYLATYFEEEPASIPIDSKLCDYHQARRTESGRGGRRLLRDPDSSADRDAWLRPPCWVSCDKCSVANSMARASARSKLCSPCTAGRGGADADLFPPDPSYDQKQIASLGAE